MICPHDGLTMRVIRVTIRLMAFTCCLNNCMHSIHGFVLCTEVDQKELVDAIQ